MVRLQKRHSLIKHQSEGTRRGVNLQATAEKEILNKKPLLQEMHEHELVYGKVDVVKKIGVLQNMPLSDQKGQRIKTSASLPNLLMEES